MMKISSRKGAFLYLENRAIRHSVFFFNDLIGQCFCLSLYHAAGNAKTFYHTLLNNIAVTFVYTFSLLN